MNNYNKILSPDRNSILFNNEKKIPWWRKARSLSPPKEEENIYRTIDTDKTTDNFMFCGNFETKNFSKEKYESNSSDLMEDINECVDSLNFKNKI
jgi:hypothetical protein